MVNKLINSISDLVIIIQRLEREDVDLTANDIKIVWKAKSQLGYNTPTSIEEGTGLLVSKT